MTDLRTAVTDQLTAKIKRHGMVIWSDPAREYADVARDLAPADVPFHRLDGSWYALRRQLEPVLSAGDPRAVIYVDQERPSHDDPFEEVRSCATEYRTRLATLVRSCYSGELGASKIDDIARTATTLAEAEALAATGGGGGPARLVKLLAVSETTAIALALLTRIQALAEDQAAVEDARAFLRDQFGLAHSGEEQVEHAFARHLVLVELVHLLGSDVPAELPRSSPQPTPAAIKRSIELLRRWRNAQDLRDSFRTAMRKVDQDLALHTTLAWDDRLAGCDAVPSYDELAFRAALLRLDAGEPQEAHRLVENRRQSVWADQLGGVDQWRTRWAVVGAVAELEQQLAEVKGVHKASVAETIREYVDHRWQVDRAHRRMELALLALVDRAPVEDAVRRARQAYDGWLDAYLRAFTNQLEHQGLPADVVLAQGAVHRDVVVPMVKHGRVAYFMVDALRYELGMDLVDALHRQFDQAEVGVRAASALLPSITPVGMANLCPRAAGELRLEVSDDHRLRVHIGGVEVRGVPDRLALLRAEHGKVTDLPLDDIFRSGENELQERVEDAAVVLVRSTEIDEQGEAGKISAHLQGFDAVVQQLSRAVARLAQHGIERFVITADHGFIALTRDLGQPAIIPKPGGVGEVHRRAFVGRGGAAGDALARIPVSKLGLPGDLDVLVPRGLALISAGGARGFFHGGASPQELLVPVITVEVAR
ncbi:MAG TPA: PglZ domain-containing protein, partial [Mycobacteriales bacterium]|nr:PglZ domain-containing protein [Mycobacteriales bacterium]